MRKIFLSVVATLEATKIRFASSLTPEQLESMVDGVSPLSGSIVTVTVEITGSARTVELELQWSQYMSVGDGYICLASINEVRRDGLFRSLWGQVGILHKWRTGDTLATFCEEKGKAIAIRAMILANAT